MEETAQKQSFMDRLVDTVTRLSEPLGRFARTPIMASLQDGMVAILPLLTIGSLFLIIGAATDGGIGIAPLAFLTPWLSQIYLVYTIGMGFLGLYAAIACGMAYARRLEVPEINAALLVVAAYMAMTFNDFTAMTSASFSASAMFPGILVAMLSVKVFSVFLKKNLTIKLPDVVPANVAGAFTSLIPYAVVIVVVWAIRSLLGFDLNAFFTSIIAPVIGAAGDNVFTFTLDRIAASLFWSLGLHYDNMTSGVIVPLMTQWTAENADAVQAGASVLPHIWCYGIHNWASKVGYTWPLVVMLLTSKAPGFHEIGVSVTLPTFFCICEPLWFGTPVVLNPYLMPGLICSWTFTGLATYLMFAADWCTRIYNIVPWATPDIAAGLLSTGDPRCLIIMGVNVIIGTICWLPFFKAYERSVMKEEEERAQLEAAN